MTSSHVGHETIAVLPANQPPDRFYRGGELIARFRGVPSEGERVPEDWIASTTCLAGEPQLGLTRLPDGRLLADAITQDPQGWLGPEHVARFGADTRLLVKLLHAGQRLPVHAHPDDAFAARWLGRSHGKVEAWHLLSGGDVYLGLREPLGRGDMARLVADQQVDRLLSALHRCRVEAGDTVYVPAGTLHAIGEGVLLLEPQQPEDLSILLEWQGFDLDGARDGHLGLGFDTALGAVDERALSESQVDALIHRAGTGGPSLPPDSAEFFRLEEHRIDQEQRLDPGFAVLVVLDGGVRAEADQGPVVELTAGSTAVVPYGAGSVQLTGRAAVVLCRPPAIG